MTSNDDENKRLSRSSDDSSTKEIICVYKIEPNDVLLGRGAPIIKNPGNIRFRDIINARKARYMSAARHDIKNQIAHEVMRIISSNHGRFLRKVDLEEASKLGVSVLDKTVWVVANEHVALQKTKQALREQGTNGVSENPGKSDAEQFDYKSEHPNIGLQCDYGNNDLFSRQGQNLHHHPKRTNAADNVEELWNSSLSAIKLQQEIQYQAIATELFRRRQREMEALQTNLSSSTFRPATYDTTFLNSIVIPPETNSNNLPQTTLSTLSRQNEMLHELLRSANWNDRNTIPLRQSERMNPTLPDQATLICSLLGPQPQQGTGLTTTGYESLSTLLSSMGTRECDTFDEYRKRELCTRLLLSSTTSSGYEQQFAKRHKTQQF